MTVNEITEIFSICRICLEEGCSKKLINPCNCKAQFVNPMTKDINVVLLGSMGGVHADCLENWLNVRNIRKCEVCDEEYRIERILKYGKLRSLIPYIGAHKSLIFNNLSCVLVIFLSVVCANVAIRFAHKNLAHNGFNFFVQLYFSVIWIFLHYFFIVECFYEVYDLYKSWRTWRTSVYTIRSI